MANTLGFQCYSLKDYEGGWQAAFETVKALGIDTLEVWGGAISDNPDAPWSMADLRKALVETGMKLTCGHLHANEFDNRYDEWKDLLLEFGSRDWVIPWANGETLDGWLAMLPKFREMAARLEQDGLSLGYHNHSLELVKMGDKYVMEHLLDNMPNLQAQFHIGQFLPERGIVLADWIRKYEGRVCSLHLNDTNAGGATPLGKGTCRAEEAIRAALDTGVDTYIFEIALRKDTLDDVKRDIDFARSLID